MEPNQTADESSTDQVAEAPARQPTNEPVQETTPVAEAETLQPLAASEQAPDLAATGQATTAPVQVPTGETMPQPQPGIGELQVTWKQQGDEVAPLLEMRAYFDQLKAQGVAVGAMKFEPGHDGKLTGSFPVSYDPSTSELARLEGTIQGLKKVGHGVTVSEAPEQAITRRRDLGPAGQEKAIDLAFPVREAFGRNQWDSLSAQFSHVPSQVLTGPEQMQQVAGTRRVKQLAEQQGKTTQQLIQDGKNLLDVDPAGNPVSAFLKNFYTHLNGAAKTRQTLEVDYEKTRQQLQDRLSKQAGSVQAQQPAPATTSPNPRPEQPATRAEAPTAAGKTEKSVAAGQQAPAPPAPAPALRFTEQDLPVGKLELFGLTPEALAQKGQLQKLLSGERTDLLPMQAGTQQEPLKFEGKLLLHREQNGSVTLKIDLPRHQLEIPNEIGGQPFTPAQRQRLETEGTAGLVRGLKDLQGNTYNGYVGVDKEMNRLVILPESKVQLADTIAGVKLTTEQSHDLREGHLVRLAGMASPNGGKPFDGTAQIHAAKAGVEVRPEPYELGKKQAPAAQERQLVTTKVKEAPAKRVPKQAAAKQPKQETPTPETPRRTRSPRVN